MEMLAADNAAMAVNADIKWPIPIVPIDTKFKKIVVVIGPTGSGKSTIVNMLYNGGHMPGDCTQPCETGASANSVTKQTNRRIKNGIVYTDTTGFGDPNISYIDIVGSLRSFISRFNNGVHCIVIVARYGRISSEDRANLQLLDTIFESSWVNSAALLLTHYDGEFDDVSAKNAINKWCKGDDFVVEFLERIGRSIILTDNTQGRHEKDNRNSRKNCLLFLQRNN